MDTGARTLVTSLLWALGGLLVMAGAGLAFTGAPTVGGGLAAVNAVPGRISHAACERLGAIIGWGRHV